MRALNCCLPSLGNRLPALLILTAAFGLMLPGCSEDDEMSPPAAPGGLSARAVSESEIRLEWTDFADNEQGFEIHESVGDAAHFSAVSEAQPNTGEFLLTGREPNTTYYYLIRAFNPAGVSGFSDTAAAATTDVPPLAPSILIGRLANGTDIRWTWRDNSAVEDGFKVYQSVGAEGGFSLVQELPANRDSLTVYDLERETVYRCRVTAFNSFGESEYTESPALTTGAPVLMVDVWYDLDPPEIPVGVNLYLNGKVTTLHGALQRGVEVFFGVEPAGIGSITPFARTEPDSANGFRTTVTFNGLTDGVAKIIAHIEDDAGGETARDSVYVVVTP